jgi:hypothetical protein
MICTLVQDSNFHMGQKQLPSTIINFSHQQVDIVVTKDGIRTLVNIVIANPTHVNLLF